MILTKNGMYLSQPRKFPYLSICVKFVKTEIHSFFFFFFFKILREMILRQKTRLVILLEIDEKMPCYHPNLVNIFAYGNL